MNKYRKQSITILNFITALLLGISLGASLAEEVLLVPFWKNLRPNAFYEWYTQYAFLLVAFYSPLQICSAVLTLTAFVGGFVFKEKRIWYAFSSATFSLAVLVTFFLFFREANANFLNKSIPITELSMALDTWGTWQWIRIGLQFLASGSFLIYIQKEQ